MKAYSQFLKELPSKKVVFAFGRFQPPTIGHELLVKAVDKLAKEQNASHCIYASKTEDKKSNPLPVSRKVYYLKRMFPEANIKAAGPTTRTLIEVAKELNKKYKNLIMVAGSDRVPEYKRLLEQYNGKDYNFDTIQVVSAGERDPDSDSASGMSGTKMREAAKKGDFASFKKGLPHTLTTVDAKRLMNELREGMGLGVVKEQVKLTTDWLRESYYRGEIYNVGQVVESSGKQYEILSRGSNYLTVVDTDGNTSRKWITDVTLVEDYNPKSVEVGQTQVSYKGYKTQNFDTDQQVVAAFNRLTNLPDVDPVAVLNAIKATDLYLGVAKEAEATDSLDDEQEKVFGDNLQRAQEYLVKLGDIQHHQDYIMHTVHTVQQVASKYHTGTFGDAFGEEYIKIKGILEMKFNTSDKIKVARIIADALGVVDVEKSSNAEQLINNSLRKIRNKPLRPEYAAIVKKMLGTADEAGIEYDKNLVPKPVTEAKKEEQYGSEYQDMVKRVGEKAKQGKKKTIWVPNPHGSGGRYKVVPVTEGNGYDDNRRGFGKPPREDDEYHVPDPTIKKTKLKKEEAPVAPTLDRKYIKGTPEHKAYKATKKPINGMPTNKMKEEVELSEAAPFKTKEDAVKYATDKVKTHRDSDDGIEVYKHKAGGYDVNHTMNSSGRNSLHKSGAKHLGTVYKNKPTNIKEDIEVDLEEAIKLGTKVKMHAPGKDYHDSVGSVGEIRHGAFKGAAKTYTVDYGNGKSVQLGKQNVKLHKEESSDHHAEAEMHLSKANDADAKGDKKSFHAHMANHHDSMSEWHDSKGRSASADKHAEKADYHHEKSISEETTPYYNKSSFLKRMGRIAKQERLAREKKEKEAKPIKESEIETSDYKLDKNGKKYKAHKLKVEQAITNPAAGHNDGHQTLKYSDLARLLGVQQPFSAGPERSNDDLEKYKEQPKDVEDAQEYQSSATSQITVPHMDPAVHGQSHSKRSYGDLKHLIHRKVKYALGEETETEDELDDDEFDDEVNSMSEPEHIIDAYDDEELAVVDDDTGEELLGMHEYKDEDDKEEVKEQVILEAIGRMERIRRAQRFARTKSKREARTKIALRRTSNMSTINKRSRRLAVSMIKKRMLRKDPATASVQEKERIERFLQTRKAVVDRLARRVAPRIRQIEKARLQHKKYTK